MSARSGSIPSNIAVGANQSIRRNSLDNAWEAFTPSSGGTPAGAHYDIQINNGSGGFDAITAPTICSAFLMGNISGGIVSYSWVSGGGGVPAGSTNDVQLNNGSGGFSSITGISTSGFFHSMSVCYGVVTSAYTLANGSGVLTNDGYGNLSWASGGGGWTPPCGSGYLYSNGSSQYWQGIGVYTDYALNGSTNIYVSKSTIYYLDQSYTPQQMDVVTDVTLNQSTSSFVTGLS